MEPDLHVADREKRTVALSSVLAAVFLTTFKLVVGLLTNSLGILSEAAHSGLDLVAALVTFLAVRVSGRPPDPQHHFGHGKVENLSALLETLLLLATCVWIIYEAVSRLFFRHVEVEASLWAFLVMGFSILVDIGRSRALGRVARKHNSQALEADALHFSTDIWSSSVVIVGLGLVRLADLLPRYRTWLLRADALAALVVAGIVIWISIQLGRRTVDALLDRAPEGLEERIRAAVGGVEHVRECGPLRLRMSGPTTFIEITVRVAPDIPAGLAHQVTTQVEEAVAPLCRPCDVIVHVEPLPAEDGLVGQVKAIAAEAGLAVHDLRVHRLADGYHVNLDLELSPSLSLEEAHGLTTAFEERLRARLPELAAIETHIEVAPALPNGPGEEVTADYQEIVQEVERVVAAQEGVTGCHDIRLRRVDGLLYASLHCLCPATVSMEQAHLCSTQIEGRLHEALPQVAHFLVHVEPE
jgi:cation diffusion facilitator family transporter